MEKSAASFDGYFIEQSAPVRAKLEELRALVRDALPEATEDYKSGAPVFNNAYGVTVAYLHGGADHASLGFVRGAALHDPDGLLEGTGDASRYVKFSPGETIPRAKLTALLRQCAGMK